MSKTTPFIILVFLLIGCGHFQTAGVESDTGLGTDPYSTGSTQTAAKLNAINNAINDNDTRLDTVEALIGPIFSDGDGTYTDMSDISSAELGHLNGVTSNLQTQIDAKLSISDLEGTPTEDEDEKAPTSEAFFDLQTQVNALPENDTNTQFFEGASADSALTISQNGSGDDVATVAAGGSYDCTNLDTTLITDLVDSDGDHSDFSRGQRVQIAMNNADVQVKFDNNSQIEGNGNTRFAGHDTQLYTLEFEFKERDDSSTYWFCPGIHGMRSPLILSLADINLGNDTLQGSRKVFSDADGINLDVGTHNSALILMTGAGTVGAWDCATESIGSWFDTFVRDASEQVKWDCYGDPSNDLFVLADGTNLDAGDEADGPADDIHSLYRWECLEENKWYLTRADGTVTDGAAGSCDNGPALGGTATFVWDGEHGSGSNYGTGDSGNLEGTATGATIHADYAYCGSYGVLLDAAGENISFSVVDGTDMDAASGTIWLKLRTPSSGTGSNSFMKNSADIDNRMYAHIKSGGTVFFAHEGNTYFHSIETSNVVNWGSWNDIGISWSTSEGSYGQISIKVNNNNWEEANGISGNPVTDFALSALQVGGDYNGDDIWIDNFVVVAGYQAALP